MKTRRSLILSCPLFLAPFAAVLVATVLATAVPGEVLAQNSEKKAVATEKNLITAPSKEAPKAKSEILKAPSTAQATNNAVAETISAPSGSVPEPKKSEVLKGVPEPKTPKTEVLKAPKETSSPIQAEILTAPKNTVPEETEVLRAPSGSIEATTEIIKEVPSKEASEDETVISAPENRTIEPTGSEVLTQPSAQKLPENVVREVSEEQLKPTASEVIKAPVGTKLESKAEVLKAPRAQ